VREQAAAALVLLARRESLAKVISASEKSRAAQNKRAADASAAVEKIWDATARRLSGDPSFDAATIATARSSANMEIMKAWAVASTAGAKDAAAELKAYGAKPSSLEKSSTSYVEKVLSDVLASTATTGAPADTVRRAKASYSAGANVVSTRAYGEAHAATTATSDKPAQLIWVTRFRAKSKSSAGTCPECAALHGATIRPGEEFDSNRTFGVQAPPTFEGLPTPPRHPRCGCKLVTYIPTNPAATATPASLENYARAWARTAPDMAPTSFRSAPPSEAARSSEFITASDVRNAPASFRKKVMAIFAAALAASSIKHLWGTQDADDQD
jgi:hypothetical protein